MSTPTLMNTAHQHAQNAEEYLNNGLLVLAAEEHIKAAEAYLAAINCTNDGSAKRTLQLLHSDHTKAGRELQRKIDTLKEEGKDPNLPQKPANSPHQAHSPSPMGAHRPNPSPSALRPMNDSHNNVDESFMLLGGQRSEPGDAFNQFWNIMQGMLDNLSQPVAFATAPLSVESPSPGPTSSLPGNIKTNAASKLGASTSYPPSVPVQKDDSLDDHSEGDEPILSKFSKRLGMGRLDFRNSRSPKPSLTKSNFVDEDFDEDILEAGDELSESFYFIPSGDEPSPLVLKRENYSLKTELEVIRKRLELAERVIQVRKDQDMQLRESIVQATREAQRAMGASVLIPRPLPPVVLPTPSQVQPQLPVSVPAIQESNTAGTSPSVNIPPVPIPAANRELQQQGRRIRELEEELRNLKTENERNKLMIAKFRERWEKLKESAKKKKEAKAAAHSVAHEPIVEEPEAEAELDGVNA